MIYYPQGNIFGNRNGHSTLDEKVKKCLQKSPTYKDDKNVIRKRHTDRAWRFLLYNDGR